MIRSLIALVLSAGVSLPAFAQSSDEKVMGALAALKDKIAQYDEGTGKALAYYGGKTVKYSLIAIGGAYALKGGANKVATEAPVATGRFLGRDFFSSYNTAGRVGTALRANGVADSILNKVGGPAVAVGIGLLGASAVVFVAEHLWYNTFGHPDQAAANNDLKEFLALSVGDQYAMIKDDVGMRERVIELNDSIHITK